MRRTAVEPGWWIGALAVGLLCTSGCVSATHYNNMMQQQEALEASLRSEIDADQVKIEQLENGIRVRMSSDLLYPSGAVDLHPKGRAALDKVAGHLATMANQNYEIDVVGNTDNVPIGPELAARFPTNWELAAERSAVIVRYLQAKGVNPAQLSVVSDGEYHPIADNDTPGGRAKNRRTDILVRPH